MINYSNLYDLIISVYRLIIVIKGDSKGIHNICLAVGSPSLGSSLTWNSLAHGQAGPTLTLASTFRVSGNVTKTQPNLNKTYGYTIWQCVKTNSTPVVHIKIAGK